MDADARPIRATGTRWAVATPHWAATDAAADVFEEGGNAVDAALAAAVTLAVVYPHMCGVGGDLFALVQETNGQALAINSSGAAPRGIDPDLVRATHNTMPIHGPLAITVPGAVAGWATLHAEGASLPWERAFTRAIRAAREGIPWASSVLKVLDEDQERFSSDPGLRGVFFAGEAVADGPPTLVQAALGDTLAAIAAGGAAALYEGEVGERYAAGLRRAGSPMTARDLREHRADVVAPLAGRYRDLDVRVVPPNSQGFVLLEMLAAIERLGVDPDPLGPDAGLIARVFLEASADRERHNADPRAARVPFETLLDEGHVAAIADFAREGAATGSAAGAHVPASPTPSGDTIALVTADGDGRAVSLIQSLFDGFGAGILEPSTGVVAHNRGAGFSLDPASKNVLAGGKRPAHTLMPVLVHRGDRVAAVSGTMGGYAQPQINAFSILRSFDLGLPPDDVLARPRWLVGGMEPLGGSPIVEAEGRVPAATIAQLESAGLRPVPLPDLSSDVGHAHLLRVGEDGELHVASDPRSDGAARAG